MKLQEAIAYISDKLIGMNGRTKGEDAAVVVYQEMRALKARIGRVVRVAKAYRNAALCNNCNWPNHGMHYEICEAGKRSAELLPGDLDMEGL